MAVKPVATCQRGWLAGASMCSTCSRCSAPCTRTNTLVPLKKPRLASNHAVRTELS
ncbi:hypothetical protein D3C71_2138010 [compost metagenome]